MTMLFLALRIPVWPDAGESDAAEDAASLLQLWKVYRTLLGVIGTGVVFDLSEVLSDCSHDITSSAATNRYAVVGLHP